MTGETLKEQLLRCWSAGWSTQSQVQMYAFSSSGDDDIGAGFDARGGWVWNGLEDQECSDFAVVCLVRTVG